MISVRKLPVHNDIKPLKSSDYPLEKFKISQIYGVELNQTLQSFLKNGYSPDQLENYAIYIHSCHNFNNAYFRRHIYHDTRYYFVLCVKAKDRGLFSKKRAIPIACIGFDEIKNDDGTTSIIIRQLQGRRGAILHLARIKWERLLVRIVKDWACQNGYSTIKMIRAKQSPWYSNADPQRMYLKYDVTARRSGFKLILEENLYAFQLV